VLDKLCGQYAAKGQANLAAMLSLLLQDPLRAVEYYRCVDCSSPVLLVHKPAPIVAAAFNVHRLFMIDLCVCSFIMCHCTSPC
jgi:hypothetical protein